MPSDGKLVFLRKNHYLSDPVVSQNDNNKHIAYVFRKLEPRAIMLPGAGNNRTGRGARVISALYIKKQLITYGVNSKRSHPFQLKYGKNENAIYFHAETNALKRALDNIGDDLMSANTTLFILRVKSMPNNNKIAWGCAKPCIGCMRAIIMHNIKRVIFSLDSDDENDRNWEVWNLR